MTPAAPHSLLRIFLLIVVAATVARVAALVATPLDLHGDEAQYWMWSRTLDWGYFSKPPLIAWAIAATTSVFGDAEWAVRLAAPIAHAGGSIALFFLARRMAGPERGDEAGLWAGLGWLLMPGVWLSSTLISTDALLLPLWSLALYAAWRLVEGPTAKWAAILGLAIGFGLLAKYAMSYFAIGLAIASLWSAPVRRAFLSRFGALAGAVAAMVVMPNLLWNAANDFATIEHTAANADWSGPRINAQAALDFIVDQVGLIGPILFVLLAIAAWPALARPRTADPRWRFLIAFAAPPLVIILMQALISRAHGNWAATAYPAAMVLIAMHFAQPRRRRIVAGAAGLHAAFGLVFLAALISPAIADGLGLGNGLKRVRQWEETAAIVRERVAAGAPDGPYTAVLVDNRLVFNDLSYYWRNDDPPPPLRMWLIYDAPYNQAERTAPMRVEDGVRVLIVGATPSYEPWIAGDFASVTPVERIDIPLGGGKSRALTFRVGRGFDPAPRDAAYIARIKNRTE